MAASTNSTTLVLNQQDANSVNIVNRTIGAIVYGGIVGQFQEGLLTGTGSSSLTLPTANVLQFYMRNLHSTATITITATKQGGTGSVVSNVGPNGVFMNWSATSGATNGYTAIALTSDTAGAPFETFIGG